MYTYKVLKWIILADTIKMDLGFGFGYVVRHVVISGTTCHDRVALKLTHVLQCHHIRRHMPRHLITQVNSLQHHTITQVYSCHAMSARTDSFKCVLMVLVGPNSHFKTLLAYKNTSKHNCARYS